MSKRKKPTPFERRSQDWVGSTVRRATPEELAHSVEKHPRPTGKQIFDSKTKEEQDAILGPTVAQAVRDGTVKFEDLTVVAPMETEPDFIRQATPKDLGLDQS